MLEGFKNKLSTLSVNIDRHSDRRDLINDYEHKLNLIHHEEDERRKQDLANQAEDLKQQLNELDDRMDDEDDANCKFQKSKLTYNI